MMMMTYKHNNNERLTSHFSVGEFRCKCGKSHDIKIDGELVEKLEELYNLLDCSKIIVNSGYRCPDHDKNVGGSGGGMHTNGQAADIVCYDKEGKIFPAGVVCCAAQEIGFSGIANIDSTYTAVHVDTRSGNKWYGDEAVPGGTSASVCTDFYKYYGLDKAENDVKTGTIEIDGVKYKYTLEKV